MSRNSSIPKVGLITTMSLDSTWPEEIVQHALDIHYKAKAMLNEMGYELVAKDEIARTNSEMVRQGEFLRTEQVEVLVLQVATWTYSSTSISAALASNVPVIIWSDGSEGSFGIVGASVVRGSLDEMGILNTILHGTSEDLDFRKKLDLLCRSFSAATRLRGQTYGVGGLRCMGMYTAVVDPVEWREKFGIDIDNWEQSELLMRAMEMGEDEPRSFLEWMRSEFGRIVPKEEVMLAQIRLYLALKEMVIENSYDFISVKCLPEFPGLYTTCCLAHAMFNDLSDVSGIKESTVCACEADANGALTMQILKHLTGGPTLFADVLRLDVSEDMITLCNCGSQPTDFAPCRKDVWWVTEGLREFNWKIGGACPQYVAKPGRVTLARLSRIKGKYVMLVTKGMAISKERDALRKVNYHQPQVFVKLDCSLDAFVNQLRSNHIHMVYGNYEEHLKRVCEVLDITIIQP